MVLKGESKEHWWEEVAIDIERKTDAHETLGVGWIFPIISRYVNAFRFFVLARRTREM